MEVSGLTTEVDMLIREATTAAAIDEIRAIACHSQFNGLDLIETVS
jgi:hypothetical protein